MKLLNILFKPVQLIHRLFLKRSFYFIIIFLIQILIFINFLDYLSNSLIFNAVSALLNIITVLFISSSHDNPSYKLSWILVVLIIPHGGWITYLLFGSKKLSRSLRRQLANEEERQREYRINTMNDEELFKNLNPDLRKQFEFLRNNANYPCVKNTISKFYDFDEHCFDEMLADLKKARKFIFMEYFILHKGYMLNRLLKVLKEKAKEGVTICLMYDDGGSVDGLDYNFIKNLKKNGIKACIFNPIRLLLAARINNRDHRKLLVVDNKVAYLGGFNIGDEYINRITRFGVWKDSAIRLEGEAVSNVSLMFIELFNASSKYNLDPKDYLFKHSLQSDSLYLAFSDFPTKDSTNMRDTHLNMIYNASNYIYIMTPYLILDYTVMQALISAKKSGVEVNIIIPKIPDKKLVYLISMANAKILMDNGINIYTYTPGFIHSKNILCDDEIALVATANMDYRSYYLNFENGVLLNDPNSIKKIKNDFLNTFKISEKLNKNNIIKSNLLTKILEMIINLFAPLF